MDMRPPNRGTILESFIQSKSGNLNDCEDRIHISDHFVAVIDGATSNTQDRWNGKTSGWIAAELIDTAFHHMPHDCTARQAADRMTAAIQAFYREHHFETQAVSDPASRATASVVAISLFRQEVWSIGDCQFMLDNQVFSVRKKVDEVTEEARAFFLASELISGRHTVTDLQAHDTGREFIQPLLARQNRFQNNPDAGAFYYAAVDGFPIPDDGVVAESIPDHVSHIVLASDGYPFLRSSLAESERLLDELLQNDPLLFRQYKSTKGLVTGNVSFDDRAYVKIGLCRPH